MAGQTKYRYVRFGTELPVRVTLSPDGEGFLGTEAPNRMTGELEISRHFKRLDGDDCWDITEAEFDDLLAAYRAKIHKKPHMI